jgi:hypothetical protein
MSNRIFIALIFLTLWAGAAFAEAPHTPPVNSPERKAILDALRVPFERQFKQPVKFDVSHFKVLAEWAFVLGSPLNAQTGKALRAEPVVDPDFCGLLRRNARGEWTVVDHAAGFGDPTYAAWPKAHGAPLSIFPEAILDMQKYYK